MSDTPTIEERYISATQASNLKVEADKGGAADIIIAAGWSPSRVGQALMRLASEWDGAAKRPKMSDTDLILLRGRLKSLTSVLVQVTYAMGKMGIQHAEDKAGPIVAYWLHEACHRCNGLKFEPIANTPSLSTIRCRSCHGTGLGWAPGGTEGRRVLAWLDDCVIRGRSAMVKRLQRF